MELLIERAKKQGKAKKRSFMKKHILQLGGHAVANVSRTIAHRVTKGPIYPNFSVRNELFYQLMLELMDKHYLLSWQEWRHLMPMQPIPRWHLRRTKVVLKNGLKTEFITYVPRRRRRSSKREKKLRNKDNNSTDTEGENGGAASSVSDVEDNHSHRSNSDRESDMFYGDAEDFEDGEDGAEPDGSGNHHHHKHKLDGKTQSGAGTDGAVAGQIVDGPADGNYRGVKDVGLDTPTIIYFHGGGFCFGSVPVYRRWLWTFSRKLGGIRFFAVDYSLAPEAPFPIALKQALDAYLWLTDPNGGGVSPQNVIMGGDSAGGNLVGSLLLLLRQLRLEKELKIMNGLKNVKSHASADGHHQADLQDQPAMLETEPAQLEAGKPKRRASLTSSKGKDINEPEQMIDETSDQKQERLQDDELEFGDETEEDVNKERQLHRDLQVRRQSMADMKGAAQVAKKKIADDRKLKEKVHSSSGVDEVDLHDSDSEAAGLPTLKAIDFDMKLVKRHRIPFELDDDQVGAYPSMPLAAMQISPWVDVSENSSVHSPDSWGLMKFRPYNISVRFALAYLGLEATNPEEAKKKEKETRKEYNGIVKLFHKRKASRRQRLLSKKEKHHSISAEQDAANTTPQLGVTGADGGQTQPAIVPSLYVDDEPAVVPGTTELTPTAMWRDRMRRNNSVLSCTNLLARSAARTALQTGEVEIAIGEKLHGDAGPIPVLDADADAHVATSSADAPSMAEQAEAQDQGEPEVFDICSPYISPVYGDLRGFPPLLVTAGDVEPLLGDIMRYYNKAVEVGVEAELDLGVNMNHDYQFFFSAVAMNDPQIPRFWGVAREWVHRQIQRDIQPSGSSSSTSASASASSSSSTTTPSAIPSSSSCSSALNATSATIAPSSPATAHLHA